MRHLLVALVMLSVTAETSACSAWGSCASDQNCCPSGYYCKYFNKWYSQCKPGSSGSKSSSSKKSSSSSSSGCSRTIGKWGNCRTVKCCVSGYSCKFINNWYSQCRPGSSSSSGSSKKSKTPSYTPSYTPPSTPTPPRSTPSPPSYTPPSTPTPPRSTPSPPSPSSSSESSSSGSSSSSSGKMRVIDTTDMGADPDDEESLVRQLVMSNNYEIEGLITNTGCWKKSQSNTKYVDKIINAYSKVYSNLKTHSSDFPSPSHLKSVSVVGQSGYGMSSVGSGKDSKGSNLIISAVDKSDSRPLWVMCWGGCNTAAQALYKVKNSRSSSALKKFVSKMRIYDVLGQDNAGTWIAKTFPDLLYIRATAVYGWQPSDSYVKSHIQSKGALGGVYPTKKYALEGDTPSFMHVANPGLNDPDDVTQGGWGGRFGSSKSKGIRGMSCMSGEDSKYDTYYMYGNVDGNAAIKKFSTHYNNDFQARMTWSVKSSFSGGNHHPVPVVNGNSDRAVLYMSASAGASVTLSASGSKDPDGNSITYKWAHDSGPSTYSGSVSVSGSSSSKAKVSVPSGARGKTVHILLTLKDSGSPNLYGYKRVVIKAN